MILKAEMWKSMLNSCLLRRISPLAPRLPGVIYSLCDLAEWVIDRVVVASYLNSLTWNLGRIEKLRGKQEADIGEERMSTLVSSFAVCKTRSSKLGRARSGAAR
jgi:hypothetical protein